MTACEMFLFSLAFAVVFNHTPYTAKKMPNAQKMGFCWAFWDVMNGWDLIVGVWWVFRAKHYRKQAGHRPVVEPIKEHAAEKTESDASKGVFNPPSPPQHQGV